MMPITTEDAARGLRGECHLCGKILNDDRDNHPIVKLTYGRNHSGHESICLRRSPDSQVSEYEERVGVLKQGVTPIDPKLVGYTVTVDAYGREEIRRGDA